MEKKVFNVALYVNDKFAEIWCDHEYFNMEFTENDEWNSIELENGEIYDIHILIEDGYTSNWEVSVYRTRLMMIVHNTELSEIDTSEEGQQIVNLDIIQ